MEALENWLKEFLHAVVQAIIDFFIWLIDFVKDIFLWLVDSLLTAIVALIKLIPLPDFITNGLQAVTDGLPPLLLYFLNHSGLTIGFGIIASGYIFKLLRKFATLFQW